MWALVARIFSIAGQISLGSTFERWFGGTEEEKKNNPTMRWLPLVMSAAVMYGIYKFFGKKIAGLFK